MEFYVDKNRKFECSKHNLLMRKFQQVLQERVECAASQILRVLVKITV